MLLLTCSSRLLFYSLLLSQLSVNVCADLFGFFSPSCMDSFKHQKNGLCECTLTWVPWSVNFFAFSFSLAPAALVYCVGHSSFKLLFFVHCPSLLLCLLCLQLWPLLCDLYDISDSAQRFLLYFDCLQFISLPRVSCVHAFSLVTPKMGARLLNVYSNVSHQWCRARWAECNHMLYVFIKLWLPPFLLHISFSISQCLCHSTLLYEKLLWMPFSPPGRPFLFFFFFLKKNRTTIMICQHQVGK